MKNNLHKIQRLVIATAFASSIVTAGIAASAQTTAAPAPVTTSNSTNVAMSTVDQKAQRRAELEAANADARRVAFIHQGTSL